MAETPENPEETTDETPEAVDAVEAAEADTTGEAEAADAAPATPGVAPRTARAEARATARRSEASARPSRTPEERQAERDEVRKAKAAARRRRRLQEREKKVANRTEIPEPTPPLTESTGRRKVRQGIVVSSKADKTITVRIDTSRRHRRYEKIVRSSSTLHAHDETNDAGEGDVVRIVESRPLSKTKRWQLDSVLERAK
jgi:small subunit ribosomal protein S17